MAKRNMPVDAIESDEKQYYWLVDTLQDGSILVMTEGNVCYHVMPNGTMAVLYKVNGQQELKKLD